jgi:hypothetical protein
VVVWAQILFFDPILQVILADIRSWSCAGLLVSCAGCRIGFSIEWYNL